MVNEISNGPSNGKRSEAVESDVGVRVEVGMCEAESGGMCVTVSPPLAFLPSRALILMADQYRMPSRIFEHGNFVT